RTVSFFEPRNIHLGSHVRIDGYTVISAAKGLHIGNYVHIACFCQIVGAGGPVVFEDFAGLSARVSVYTSTDDYTGGSLTNPTVPDRYKQLRSGPVTLKRHVIVGCGSVLMPGVTLETGASVGALTFVNKSVPSNSVVAGHPMRVVGQRNGERLLALEAELREAESLAR
ncbi:MAG: acyltransferase, partial [Deltaproteobacteria bacterium]